MAQKKNMDASSPIIIKKYANRRLYNTETSSYITLELLSQMTREGREFVVVDAKTDEDITHNVLTQIIMEEEQRGKNMLPVNFLRQLISMYGDSMQSMVPQYLESSMEAFRKNQEQFQQAMVVEAEPAGGQGISYCILPRRCSSRRCRVRLPRGHSPRSRSATWRCWKPQRTPSCRTVRQSRRRPRQKMPRTTRSRS